MGQDEQAIGSNDGGGGVTQSSGVEGGETKAPGPNEGQPTAKEQDKRVDPSSPGETGTTPGTNGK